jgi:hypothetical protein
MGLARSIVQRVLGRATPPEPVQPAPAEADPAPEATLTVAELQQIDREMERLAAENEALRSAVDTYDRLARQMAWLVAVAPRITWTTMDNGKWGAIVSRMDFGEIAGRTLDEAVERAMLAHAKSGDR